MMPRLVLVATDAKRRINGLEYALSHRERGIGDEGS